MKAHQPTRRAARKPARRGYEKRVHRHEQILSAAFEVFAARGFEAARIDEVAAQAGVAKGTVYLYFKNKEQLFRAVVRSLIPKRLDLLVKTLPGRPPELLRGLAEQMYTNIVRNRKVRAIVRMLISESGRFPQLAEIYHREIIAPGMKALRGVLADGIAAGDFRQIKAIDFPQIIAAPALLAMVWQLLFDAKHPLDLNAYQQAHVELVQNSLRKPQD